MRIGLLGNPGNTLSDRTAKVGIQKLERSPSGVLGKIGDRTDPKIRAAISGVYRAEDNVIKEKYRGDYRNFLWTGHTSSTTLAFGSPNTSNSRNVHGADFGYTGRDIAICGKMGIFGIGSDTLKGANLTHLANFRSTSLNGDGQKATYWPQTAIAYPKYVPQPISLSWSRDGTKLLGCGQVFAQNSNFTWRNIGFSVFRWSGSDWNIFTLNPVSRHWYDDDSYNEIFTNPDHNGIDCSWNDDGTKLYFYSRAESYTDREGGGSDAALCSYSTDTSDPASGGTFPGLTGTKSIVRFNSTNLSNATKMYIDMRSFGDAYSGQDSGNHPGEVTISNGSQITKFFITGQIKILDYVALNSNFQTLGDTWDDYYTQAEGLTYVSGPTSYSNNTDMTVTFTFGGYIYEYELDGTAYDPGDGLTYLARFDAGNIYSFWFSRDGFTLNTYNHDNNVYQYSLSTAFSLSTVNSTPITSVSIPFYTSSGIRRMREYNEKMIASISINDNDQSGNAEFRSYNLSNY